jgi:hypothetical protein
MAEERKHGTPDPLDGVKLLSAGGSGFGIVLLIAILKLSPFDESPLKFRRPDSYAARFPVSF